MSSLLALDRNANVIIISGQEEKDKALGAVGAGAYDFLCKPIEIEELKLLLRRCFYVANRKGISRYATELEGGGVRGHSWYEPSDAGSVRRASGFVFLGRRWMASAALPMAFSRSQELMSYYFNVTTSVWQLNVKTNDRRGELLGSVSNIVR